MVALASTPFPTSQQSPSLKSPCSWAEEGPVVEEEEVFYFTLRNTPLAADRLLNEKLT